MISVIEACERIKDILATQENKKIKDSDVARAIGLTPNGLGQCKFKNRMPYKEILKFLQKKKISINLFFFNQDPRDVEEATQRYKILRIYIANASAGGGAINQNIKYNEIIIDNDLINRFNIKNCEALSVIGDSMDPLINNESIVFCDKMEKSIKNGKVYAINTIDGVFVKECFLQGELLKLKSINKEYPPLFFNLKDIFIIGRIRAVINKIF
nr:S24 family peptidase [Helicobacter anatolicus]